MAETFIEQMQRLVAEAQSKQQQPPVDNETWLRQQNAELRREVRALTRERDRLYEQIRSMKNDNGKESK